MRGYLCPSCAYDVSRTLDDGLTVCPECGAEVTREIADEAVRPRSAWWLICVCAVVVGGMWTIGSLLTLSVPAAGLLLYALSLFVALAGGYWCAKHARTLVAPDRDAFSKIDGVLSYFFGILLLAVIMAFLTCPLAVMR
jgi:heme A synthase